MRPDKKIQKIPELLQIIDPVLDAGTIQLHNTFLWYQNFSSCPDPELWCWRMTRIFFAVYHEATSELSYIKCYNFIQKAIT